MVGRLQVCRWPMPDSSGVAESVTAEADQPARARPTRRQVALRLLVLGGILALVFLVVLPRIVDYAVAPRSGHRRRVSVPRPDLGSDLGTDLGSQPRPGGDAASRAGRRASRSP